MTQCDKSKKCIWSDFVFENPIQLSLYLINSSTFVGSRKIGPILQVSSACASRLSAFYNPRGHLWRKMQKFKVTIQPKIQYIAFRRLRGDGSRGLPESKISPMSPTVARYANRQGNLKILYLSVTYYMKPIMRRAGLALQLREVPIVVHNRLLDST